MPTNEYSKYLLDTITEVIIMNIIILIIALIFIFLLISSIRKKEKQSICINSIILAIICFVIIGSVVYIIPFVIDIRDKSYIKYEGEYYVESIQDTGVIGAISHVKMGNGEIQKYEFIPNPDYWQEGKYQGYIVYSKRSRVILEWQGEQIAK